MTAPVGNVYIAETTDEFAIAAAHWIVLSVQRAVMAHGVCHLGLSGGSTPALVFPRLADVLPWPHLHLYWVDERAVPTDAPESNYYLAHRLLFDDRVGEAQVHRMPADAPDLEAAAAQYAALLPTRFDLLLLGLGEDGHTASLFPESPLLGETRLVAPVYDSPKPPARRLTLTPCVIAAAHELCMLATGAGKADAVARALAPDGTVVDCPARLARHAAWFIDRAAAVQMPEDY